MTTIALAPTTSLQVVESLYQAYNERSIERWLGHFAEDAVWLDVPTGEKRVGLSGHVDSYAAWSSAFPDGRCEDLALKGCDTLVVAQYNSVGLHEGVLQTPDGLIDPTLRSISLSFCDVHTIAGTKIVKTHRYWNPEDIVVQLGIQ